MWVNAGASAYTSQTSSTTSDQYTCYMRLRWFQFSYYPSLVMPVVFIVSIHLETMVLSKQAELQKRHLLAYIHILSQLIQSSDQATGEELVVHSHYAA